MGHKQSSRLEVGRVSQNSLQYTCQVAATLLLLVLLVGCSRRYSNLPPYSPFAFKEYPNESVGRFKTSYIVDQIEEFYRGTNPGPIGVTTFVNVDDLYSTSTFGRMFSEQVMGELAMKGFDVVELRHSDALQFLNTAGEFAMSRDITQVRRERNLGALLVGTYVASPQRVYVNARLLDPTNSMVLSAGSVEMDKTSEISRMLRGGAFPGTLERIPVKHLSNGAFPLYVNPAGRVYDLEEEAGSFAINKPEPTLEALSQPAGKGKKKPVPMEVP